MDKLKNWQTTIWIGKSYEQPVTLFSNSLSQLPTVTAKWLTENPPQDFSNLPADADINKRVSYFYSDGTLQPIFPLRRNQEPLDEGWYCLKGEFGLPSELKDYPAAISQLISNDLIIKEGPDYKNIPLVEDEFPVHLIKTVFREQEIRKVNDMLQRGWHILALEFDGKTDYRDNLINKTTVFLLGHPEVNAF